MSLNWLSHHLKSFGLQLKVVYGVVVWAIWGSHSLFVVISHVYMMYAFLKLLSVFLLLIY